MPGEVATEFAAYDEVPVYRRRWFFVACLLLFAPAALALALTGNIYASRRGVILKCPRVQRIFFAAAGAAAALWVLLHARG